MKYSFDTVAERVWLGEFDWVGLLLGRHFDPNDSSCKGMETWDLWPKRTARLLESGFSERVVVGILGGDFPRFWRDV